MQIVPYRAAHLPGLYEIYRRTIADVPHCRFVPSIEYTGRALDRAVQAGAVLLIAQAGATVQGIATLRPTTTGEGGVSTCEITGLFAPDEEVVVELLAACLARADGAQRIVAFPMEHGRCPLPYNAGWDGLSDQLRPVARVLARHGFTPAYRELHLECVAPFMPPPVIPVPPSISLVESSGPNYKGVRAMVGLGESSGPNHQGVRAMDGQQEAGICLYMRLSKLSDHPEADMWGYIEWLHVAEAYRRRGLGRCLISCALRRLWEAGCRGCWLTTGGDNWPAQPLYLSLGFEIVDTSSSWVSICAERS